MALPVGLSVYRFINQSSDLFILLIGKFTCLSFNRSDNYSFYRLAALQIALLIVRMIGG